MARLGTSRDPSLAWRKGEIRQARESEVGHVGRGLLELPILTFGVGFSSVACAARAAT